MPGLTYIVDWSRSARAPDANPAAAAADALHTARAGDGRIVLAPLRAGAGEKPHCTVYFSALGLLDGFTARLSDALGDVGLELLELAPAAPSERAA